jgi:hypothetical protein
LREFAKTSNLALVRKCIPHSATLNLDELFNKLITTGHWDTLPDEKSEFVPALFDLFDALARHYQDDFRGSQCLAIKEKTRTQIAATAAKPGS